MSFHAKNFLYDSIISSDYGLTITSMESNTNDGAAVELYTQQIYRRPKAYLYGVQQTPALSIPVRINVQDNISANEASKIAGWLFGRMNYKKLQILQPDMQYVYYNCILPKYEIERYGNLIRGFYSTIVCDSPFAWEFPTTKTFTYPSGYLINDTLKINNDSANDDYMYPTITFTMNSFGGNLSIINTSDSNREFLFSGLSANEVITIDNDIQTITSSTGNNRLSYFNYKWMRLSPRMNTLTLSGNISSISFTYQLARKIS